jgi:hypothetical protein
MAKPTAPTWTDIRAQLTGMRLAVYDDLSQVASIRVGADWTPEQLETLGWLHRHHLAHPVQFSDLWCSQPLAAAQARWEAEGPLSEHLVIGWKAYQAVKSAQPTNAERATAEPPPPAAYGQQAQFFDLEGYKQ